MLGKYTAGKYTWSDKEGDTAFRTLHAIIALEASRCMDTNHKLKEMVYTS